MLVSARKPLAPLVSSVGPGPAPVSAARRGGTRRNDLDGRGNLSAENLAEFTRFFLAVCLDQVTFMEGLMTPDQLRARILLWAEEEIRRTKLPPRSGAVLEALLYRGELPRGDAAAIVGTGAAKCAAAPGGLQMPLAAPVLLALLTLPATAFHVPARLLVRARSREHITRQRAGCDCSIHTRNGR